MVSPISCSAPLATGHVAYGGWGAVVHKCPTGLIEAIVHDGNSQLGTPSSASRAADSPGSPGHSVLRLRTTSVLGVLYAELTCGARTTGDWRAPSAVEALCKLPESDAIPREWRACRFCRKRAALSRMSLTSCCTAGLRRSLPPATISFAQQMLPRRSSRGCACGVGDGHCWVL